jgi:hypothetical protein
MAEGLGFDRERPDTRLVPAFIVVALALLAGCDGDTLYDFIDIGAQLDPPQAVIEEPSDGIEVTSGNRVPVVLTATDSLGISEIFFTASGAAQSEIRLSFLPPERKVQVDTAFVVPAESIGLVELRLIASNSRGTVGEADPVTIVASNIDRIPPEVGIEVLSADRMETTDTITVEVTAKDNDGGSGVATVGFTAVVTNTARADTFVVTQSEELSPPADGTVTQTFTFTPVFFDPLALPDSLAIEFSGFAKDAQGLCAANGTDSLAASGDCVAATVASQNVTLAKEGPLADSVIVVLGQSFVLPSGGHIADMLVDTTRQSVYLSNQTRHHLNVFRAQSDEWAASVPVGSEPWGLEISEDEDSLRTRAERRFRSSA